MAAGKFLWIKTRPKFFCNGRPGPYQWGQRHAEWVDKERQSARNVREELKWTLRSGFYMAHSQGKYFSTGWIRACLLLRCNQAPLRLLWAFKELAGAREIQVEKTQVLSKLDVNVLMDELFTVSFENVVGCSLLGVFPVFQLLISCIDFTPVCLVIPLSPQSAILYKTQGSILPSASSCWSQLQKPWIDWLSLCHLYLYSCSL